MTIEAPRSATATAIPTQSRSNRDTTMIRLRRRLTTILLLVAVWFVTASLGLLSERDFPPPSAALEAFVQLFTQGFAGKTIWVQIGDSLARWGLGLLVAAIVGVVIGVAVGWSRAADAAIRPIFELLRYIPPIAWGPLAILWLGTGMQSQAIVVFIAAFPPIVLNTEQAIRQVDPLLIRASRTLGAKGLRPLFDVVLPSGVGTVVTGIRIACGNGWMALMGAELIGASSGLGYLILQSQNNNNSAEILVGMVTIGLIGLAIDSAMRLAEHQINPDARKEASRGK